jgi:hypothetical protein
MEEVAADDHGYCLRCESIVHEPEKVKETISAHTDTPLAYNSEHTLNQLESTYRALAEQFSQWREEGFEVIEAQGDGHLYLERRIGDVDTDGAG